MKELNKKQQNLVQFDEIEISDLNINPWAVAGVGIAAVIVLT